MSENGIWARLMRLLRKDNNLSLAIVGVAAVGLIIYILTTMSSPGGGGEAENASPDAAASSVQGGSLEERLEDILAQVEGAGAVRVMVTYETGPEIVPAVKTDTQRSASDGTGSAGSSTTSTTESEEPVVIQGKSGSEALVLVEKVPVVLGVLVVAEGASDLGVRLKLMQAVQVALQITPDRIEVFPMNITKNREGN